MSTQHNMEGQIFKNRSLSQNLKGCNKTYNDLHRRNTTWHSQYKEDAKRGRNEDNAKNSWKKHRWTWNLLRMLKRKREWNEHVSRMNGRKLVRILRNKPLWEGEARVDQE